MCPRQTVPKATLVNNPSSILQEATGNGPRRGRGDSTVWERGSAPCGSPCLPEADGDSAAGPLHLQPLRGRPGLRAPCARGRVTSGRSETRLCLYAGLSRLPGATGFPPLPSDIHCGSRATRGLREGPVSAGTGAPARGRRGLDVKPEAEGGARGTQGRARMWRNRQRAGLGAREAEPGGEQQP